MVKKTERTKNLAHVIQVLRKHGPMTQARLKEHCQLQASTISYLVKDLKDSNFIIDMGLDEAEGKVGKPGNLIGLNNRHAQFLGIYVQDEKLEVYLIGIDGKTLSCEIIAFDSTNAESSIYRTIENVLHLNPDIKGVGITIKAIVYSNGTIKSGLRQKGKKAVDHWAFAGLAKTLRCAFPNLAILMENDANSAAELYQYQKKLKNGNAVIYLLNKEPFGIGLGLLVNGKIFKGTSGAAGEFYEKNTNIREIASKVSTEKDFIAYFMPAILPHILETAYFMDPEKIVLSGSYFERLSPKSLNTIEQLLSKVPVPVEIASDKDRLNPAKGVALLAINNYVLKFVRGVAKR